MINIHDHFGEHLTIDGYGGARASLDNRVLILDVLESLPKKLEMHILHKPIVLLAPGTHGKDPGGWSGFVIIAESHISVHTFPRRGFISADIYTCKNGLDKKIIEQYFQEKFLLKSLETHFIVRGMKYPSANIYS